MPRPFERKCDKCGRLYLQSDEITPPLWCGPCTNEARTIAINDPDPDAWEKLTGYKDNGF